MPTPSVTQQTNTLTVSQTAQKMGVKEDKVRTLCRKGKFQGAIKDRDTNRWLIPATAVDAWLAANHFPDTLCRRFWKWIKATRTWQKTATIIVALGIILGGINVVTGFISNIFGSEPVIIWICQLVSLCAPTPIPHMSGEYNIAVADLYVNTQAGSETIAQNFAQGMASVLQKHFTDTVQVWGPELVGKVEPQDSMSKVEEVAKNINADMIIYGKV